MFVTRGSFVESVHRGHALALDGRGRVVARIGSEGASAFIRSAAKPFQALPLIASGAADRFRFEARELAVACGSHNGEPVHTGAVRSMLKKVGLDVSHLKCGAHEPYSKETARELKERGEGPSPLHNNCSGNHAGLLALAVHLGDDPAEYLRPSSAAQRAVFRAVSHFSGVGEPAYATDGCGIPTFALTVGSMARMLARLVAPRADGGAAEEARGVVNADAVRRVVAAMMAHPEMVEGDGELDTELMRAARGRLVSKVGAEGVYAAGVLPCGRWPDGLGLALKIEDGDKEDRARPVAAVALLKQLGVLGAAELESLTKFERKTLKNHRGDEVGEVRAAFELDSGSA